MEPLWSPVVAAWQTTANRPDAETAKQAKSVAAAATSCPRRYMVLHNGQRAPGMEPVMSVKVVPDKVGVPN
jgi:hypothetical protein